MKNPEYMRWPLQANQVYAPFILSSLTICHSISPLWLHHPQCLWSMCSMSRWNVETKQNKQKQNIQTGVVDGGQIHGRMWEGIQRP